MQACSTCPEPATCPESELPPRERHQCQPSSNSSASAATAMECLGRCEQNSCRQCASLATTMAPAAVELDRLWQSLPIEDDDADGRATDNATAYTTALPGICHLRDNWQHSDCCRSPIASVSFRAADDQGELGVVSVPLEDLESLVARLRVAKAEMDNLRKMVDMQTTVILQLKAKICRRQRTAGSSAEPACTLGSDGKNRELPPLTSDVLPQFVAEAQAREPPRLQPLQLLAPGSGAFGGSADSRSPDARTSTRSPRRISGRTELPTVRFAPAEACSSRRPGSDGSSSSSSNSSSEGALWTPRGASRPIVAARRLAGTAATTAATGRDSAATAQLTPAIDETYAHPHVPGRYKMAAGMPGYRSAAAYSPCHIPAPSDWLTLDDDDDDAAAAAGFGASPVVAKKPNLFCAQLPAAAPSPRTIRLGRDESRSAAAAAATETEAGGAPAASGAVESTWLAARTSSQPLLVSSGSGRSCLSDTTAAAAAAAAAASAVGTLFRCPLCQRSFGAGVSTSEFQSHVLECDPSEDAVATARQASGPNRGRGGDDDDDRTCPMCAAHYPADLPRDEFERHVLSHFQDD